MKAKTVILFIFLLIAIDQTIKIIINTYFRDYQFEIIPSLIEFKPTFNDKHSYVNFLLNKNFGLNVGLLAHVIVILFLSIFVSVLFYYLRNNINNNTKLLDTAIIFLFAGIICSLIGKLIWENGTLDYIYLKPLFVFDLKDTYPDISMVLFFIYFIKIRTQLESIKSRDILLYAKNRLLKCKK